MNAVWSPGCACDGLSFAPTLLGQPPERQKQHELLYWAFYEGGGGRAARMGRWKAVQQPYRSTLRLYDIENDIGEEHDVAAANAEIVQRMTRAMDAADTPSERWKFPEGKTRPAGKKR